MEIYCTRPGCLRPQNSFADLDDMTTLKTIQQKFCTTCGMPLILDGRYLPVRLLGQGGFGAAFLARDRRTPAMRTCVVKQFQPAGDLSPQQLAIAHTLFEREAEVLERLGNKHPQIPDLMAFFPLEITSQIPGKQDRFFYLVQEFIDGQNLEEELKSQGNFSEEQVREVFVEMLKILSFVHENDTIHRDIKPSNIMRSKTNGRLYLLDFGAVKQVTQSPGVTSSGRSTGIYSMGFAPPEQMAGRTVFPSTDLYALAVTCIMLLTGKEPQELFDAYSNEWNWRSQATVSDRFADILDRLLLSTPSQRFQGVQEVLTALNATSPPPQSPPSPPSPISPQSPHFSTFEVLRGAAFTGFEGGLLLIVLRSLGFAPAIGTIAWLLILSALIFVQYRRFIEKYDLLILAVVTLAIVFFIPPFHQAFLWEAILFIPVFASCGAVAFTALFRLISKLIAKFL
ncbi:bifunctional serine/threonine protein kinase/MFS transporter [Oscillatoria sp. HE19RPO]|uniref:bifunctional serine/threonine protein kinase/MFS transporter n=1 Tax=Oscillatoria sp. HE19RPO TaxID=2954806 RepID=UPI0020C3CE64|nr:bifunctional serine/threonine protein kinase/MFS transporter [Oscillatoria sp. HE19RPO]